MYSNIVNPFLLIMIVLFHVNVFIYIFTSSFSLTASTIISFLGNLSGEIVWGALDDVVMGGVSESTFQILPTGSESSGPTGLFKGICIFIC